MFEALSASFANNFLWISACIFIVTVAKIGVDIFGRYSTRRILKNAESLEQGSEDELRRRVEQASRRLKLDTNREEVRFVPNRRLLH